MKPVITLLLLSAFSVVIFSCKKLTAVPITDKPLTASTTSLSGNWSLVNDSTVTDYWGLWYGRQPTGINYPGQANDHYIFMPDGSLYIKEGNNVDTATYTLMKNNGIVFTLSYANGPVVSGHNAPNYVVSNLTDHSLTLTGDTAVTPETVLSHIINLKK